MVLSILIYILIFIASFFLETFLSALGGLSIVSILMLFVFKKLDWKLILIFGSLLSISLDVVNHYVLGTSILLFGIALLIYYLFTLIFPEQNNILGLLPYFVSFVFYYLLKILLPHLLLYGSIGAFQGSDIFGILIKSVISSALIFLFSILYNTFRGDKRSSKLVLK